MLPRKTWRWAKCSQYWRKIWLYILYWSAYDFCEGLIFYFSYIKLNPLYLGTSSSAKSWINSEFYVFKRNLFEFNKFWQHFGLKWKVKEIGRFRFSERNNRSFKNCILVWTILRMNMLNFSFTIFYSSLFPTLPV